MDRRMTMNDDHNDYSDDSQEEQAPNRLEAPTAKQCIPISGNDLEMSKMIADDHMYRITTVSMDPLSIPKFDEFEPGVGVVDYSTENSVEALDVNSISGYMNVYHMPLWELILHLVPWISRKGSSEKIIEIECIGVFKGFERYPNSKNCITYDEDKDSKRYEDSKRLQDYYKVRFLDSIMFRRDNPNNSNDTGKTP
jgi:hypothetical protein